MTPDELRRERLALGLTQDQLAKELRTTRMTVTRYECGTRRIPGVVGVLLRALARRQSLPMMGVVAAGVPIEPIAQGESVDVPTGMIQAGGTYVLKVKGYSMQDEGILPGDLVVVKKQSSARTGQVVVASVNREVTIKTYVANGQRIELHPANPSMQPLVVSPRDEFAVEGIVVGVIRHCP
ncbi:MAG: transcriptional repressor LexA [Nitrospiraceae bacterium]